MEFLNVLTREEMKNVKGGNCQVYSFGEWVGDCQVSVSTAQDLFNNHPDVTGYCCDSCGQTGFMSAGSC